MDGIRLIQNPNAEALHTCLFPCLDRVLNGSSNAMFSPFEKVLIEPLQTLSLYLYETSRCVKVMPVQGKTRVAYSTHCLQTKVLSSAPET